MILRGSQKGTTHQVCDVVDEGVLLRGGDVRNKPPVKDAKASVSGAEKVAWAGGGSAFRTGNDFALGMRQNQVQAI